MAIASSPVDVSSSAAEHVGPPPSYTARSFFRMARGFWTGSTKLRAWLLTLGVLAFLLANLSAALGVNRWN